MLSNAPLVEFTESLRNMRDPHNAGPPYQIPPAIMTDPHLKKRKDLSLQHASAQLPNQHFLSYTMYSQSGFRWAPALSNTYSSQQMSIKLN